MAVVFPMVLTGTDFTLRFFVNPTKMKVKKESQISEIRTMNGTTFQVWPDLPDEISIEGVSFGIRSIIELRNLKQAVTRAPEDKEISLTYKFRTYKGYMRDLVTDIDADKPRQFHYSFNFVSKDPFNLEDLTLGQLTGLEVERAFFAGQVRGAKQVLTFSNLTSEVAGEILSTLSGTEFVRENIGRVALKTVADLIPLGKVGSRFGGGTRS